MGQTELAVGRFTPHDVQGRTSAASAGKHDSREGGGRNRVRNSDRGAADSRPTAEPIDAIDRRIIIATQAGLPLTHQPYHQIAEELALEPAEVMRRVQRMLANGVIRRIGAVPNHYALGYRANAMTVWDVPDTSAQRLGQRVGQLDFVSHCYRRPRHLPHWPFNLFAMVHGHDRDEVEAKVAHIAALLGRDNRGHALLYSTRILKKTGLRIGEALGVKSKPCLG